MEKYKKTTTQARREMVTDFHKLIIKHAKTTMLLIAIACIALTIFVLALLYSIHKYQTEQNQQNLKEKIYYGHIFISDSFEKVV